jgi:hypothetical protein
MPSLKHPCGCVFDAEFVDEVHHEEGQSHTLKGAKAEKQEPPKAEENETSASLMEKVDEVLSRVTKKKK